MYNYKYSNINRLFKTNNFNKNNCNAILFKNNCNKKLKFKKMPLKKLKKDKNMSFNNYVFLYKNKAIIYNNCCFKIKHLNYKNSNFLNLFFKLKDNKFKTVLYSYFFKHMLI